MLGRPPIYPIGCAGLQRHERLADGRSNALLHARGPCPAALELLEFHRLEGTAGRAGAPN